MLELVLTFSSFHLSIVFRAYKLLVIMTTGESASKRLRIDMPRLTVGAVEKIGMLENIDPDGGDILFLKMT